MVPDAVSLADSVGQARERAVEQGDRRPFSGKRAARRDGEPALGPGGHQRRGALRGEADGGDVDAALGRRRAAALAGLDQLPQVARVLGELGDAIEARDVLEGGLERGGVAGRVAQPEGAERAGQLVRFTPRVVALLVAQGAEHHRRDGVVDRVNAGERSGPRLLPELLDRGSQPRIEAWPACHGG